MPTITARTINTKLYGGMYFDSVNAMTKAVHVCPEGKEYLHCGGLIGIIFFNAI